MSAKAKAAFAFAEVSLDSGCKCSCTATGKCTCKNCNEGNPNAKCVCGCVTTGTCVCKDCNHPMDLEAIYAKAIEDGQPVIIEVAGVTHLVNTPWRVVQVKAIQGEKPGYIVGVPKNGKLVRVDFNVYTSQERIRMGILHTLYPLTPGWFECPKCPTGRIWGGSE